MLMIREEVCAVFIVSFVQKQEHFSFWKYREVSFGLLLSSLLYSFARKKVQLMDLVNKGRRARSLLLYSAHQPVHVGEGMVGAERQTPSPSTKATTPGGKKVENLLNALKESHAVLWEHVTERTSLGWQGWGRSVCPKTSKGLCLTLFAIVQNHSKC